MNTVKTIQLCVLTNTILLFVIFAIVYNIADKNLLRIGYSDELVILGVPIDTYSKYITLHIIIFTTEFFYALIYEYANPIMYFNIFNEDKKEIEEFTKNQLQFYAQALWFSTSIKNSVMLLVSIQQLDILVSKCISYEIAVFFVIRKLLSKKTFLSSQ
jgi:hypothetical protein